MEIKTAHELKRLLTQLQVTYSKGVITHAEFLVRANQLIQYALLSGVTWHEINQTV